MVLAWRTASSALSTGPPLHAATGTFVFSASSFASILSPRARIASAGGPTKTSPILSHSSAKAGSSATKPHPTHTASARHSVRARSSSWWSR